MWRAKEPRVDKLSGKKNAKKFSTYQQHIILFIFSFKRKKKKNKILMLCWKLSGKSKDS